MSLKTEFFTESSSVCSTLYANLDALSKKRRHFAVASLSFYPNRRNWRVEAKRDALKDHYSITRVNLGPLAVSVHTTGWNREDKLCP